jgi:riboflavin biosynthesis pyrimidine reductase
VVRNGNCPAALIVGAAPVGPTCPVPSVYAQGGGRGMARTLTELGLIDEYRIYLHPVVLGHGTPCFAGPRPPLRLVANDRIGDVIRLVYVPA